MGNIVATLVSIPLPLVSDIIIVPHLWSPERWGNIPWTPPPFWISEIINVILMICVSTSSGVMTSLQKCKRKNLSVSLQNSKWQVIGYIIGRIFALLAFPLKTMIISSIAWMPFAKQISEGIITSAFVLLFGMIGNSNNRKEICASE